MDEIMKRVAAIKRLVLLPKRSQSIPAQEAPSTHPSKTQLAAHPVCAGERWKNFSMKPMAPEMTAVSYPKSSPPIAATQVTRMMKGALPSDVPVLEIGVEFGSGGMFMGFMRRAGISRRPSDQLNGDSLHSDGGGWFWP